MIGSALRDDIVRFFDDFVTAFCTFKGAQVAELYLIPGVALRGDGLIQGLQSRAEVERFFQRTLDRYHAEGSRTCRYKELEVVPLGGRSALGTVTWELLGEDGGVLKQWRQSYNLVRTDDGWRVLASTYHLPAPAAVR
jgi:hypothetical protein